MAGFVRGVPAGLVGELPGRKALCAGRRSTHGGNRGREVRCTFTERSERLSLKNFTYTELEEWCSSQGESQGRAKQLWRWMYHDGCWLEDLDDAREKPNGFAEEFRSKVRDFVTVGGGLKLLDISKAKDGTQKLVFLVESGEAAGSKVETVLIPVVRGKGERAKQRITACVSSQVGCAMNCQFCYTGRMGFMANLTTAQIVEQLVVARRVVAQQQGLVTQSPTPITNVVFMGMGEPFNNLQPVLQACRIMRDDRGLHLSAAKITVSTVGLVPEIREFCSAVDVELAVSLHAATDEVRDWIVPINRKHNLGALMAVLKEFFPRVRQKGRPKQVCFEYVMLRDVNDSEEDARQLLALTEDVECNYNLIQFNPFEGAIFSPSPLEQVKKFQKVVVEAGRLATVRSSRGDDEMAACGQLGSLKEAKGSGVILEPPQRFKTVVGL